MLTPEKENGSNEQKMAAKKQIVCPKCKAKLKFDPVKIKAVAVKFKCPGCASVLSIKKPDSLKKLPPPAAATGSQALKPEKPAPANMGKTGITDFIKDSDVGHETAQGQPIDPASASGIHEKTAPDVSAAHKVMPGEGPGPLMPADQPVIAKQSGESLLEDYCHEKFSEFEEGEAEPGDLEWTRYADKKAPQLPENKIDLNVLPAAAEGLQETLADLQQADMYNLQGETNLEKNLIKQAIRDFNHALEINPDYVDALVNRGSAYVLQGKFNDALQDFNHALEFEKKHPEIYNLRGEIFLLNNMHNEAIRDFTAAIILNPMCSDAYLNRAKAYSEKGMQDEADTDFDQAIKVDPDKFSNYADLAGSESLFDDESTSNKEAAAQYVKKGIVDLKNEKYYEAIENFTQALGLSPDNAQTYINRAQAYIELGQPDESMVDLNQAALFDPLDPTLYYWRAKAWKALDSLINMVEDLKVSCELGYGPACEEYEKNKPQKH